MIDPGHLESFIAFDEWMTLGLDKDLRQEAMAYRNVSQTQLSIARHYGGIKVSSDFYTYFPATDELIRDDVLKAVTKLRKQKKALGLLTEKSQTMGLYDEP